MAAEIVDLGPEVIFTSGFSTIRPLLDATRTLPIVFANVVDPVGAGFVASLARPGGNVTQRVMAQSVDPTQPREAWRFVGTLIPFE